MYEELVHAWKYVNFRKQSYIFKQMVIFSKWLLVCVSLFFSLIHPLKREREAFLPQQICLVFWYSINLRLTFQRDTILPMKILLTNKLANHRPSDLRECLFHVDKKAEVNESINSENLLYHMWNSFLYLQLAAMPLRSF